MTDTTILGLPLIEASQAQKHVTHNEALRMLDGLVMLSIKDRDLSAPPSTPADGDRYLVATSGTGSFTGHDGDVAHYAEGGWTFYTPNTGWLSYVEDEDALIAFDGASWNGVSGGGGGGGGGDLLASQNLSDLAARYSGLDNISLHGADIASASTLNLESATGYLIDVTGTTTITAITLSEGHRRLVRFTGSLTLTHGASLVLPGAQNIQTAAGDFAEFVGYSGGVVRCNGYSRGDSSALATGQTTIASASTTNLGSAREWSVVISGTTTITSFGSSAPSGSVKFVQFSGALTLTHNATSMILPGGANIATTSGDCLIARHEGSGNWRALTYLRAAGRPLSSGVGDTLTAGFSATSYSNGSKSSGTFTPDPSNGNIQHYTNGGAHTLAPPGSACTMIVECTNASAGAITTSGFSVVSGDTYSSSGTKKHIFRITRTNSYSELNVTYVTGT